MADENLNTPSTVLISLENLEDYTDYVEEKSIKLTDAEYQALPATKETDGKSYYITDKGVIYKNGVKYGETDFDPAILNNYVTKEELSEEGFLTQETDPTVPSWAKQANKPTYTKSEIGLGNVDNTADADKNVAYADEAGDASTVNNHSVNSNVPANAIFTDTTYTLSQDATDGHKLVFTPSNGNPVNITIPDNDTTYNNLNQFSNADTKFITNAVNDLANYYKKSETYTQSEIDQMISAIPKFDIEVVDSLLVEEPSTTTIYLLRNSGSETQNLYTEYIYLYDETTQTGSFEKLGEQRIDLSGYYTSAQVDTLLNGKVNTSAIGSAAAKGVDTSISAGSTSVNLPTSQAVASFVEGKGYKTTDNNTTYTLSPDTTNNKITLTPSSGTAQSITVPYATNAGNSSTVNGKTVSVNVPADAKFTDTTYTSSLTSVGSASAGTAIAADDITAWNAGTAASATVSQGVLTLISGTVPSLSYTARSIPNISVESKTVVSSIAAN